MYLENWYKLVKQLFWCYFTNASSSIHPLFICNNISCLSFMMLNLIASWTHYFDFLWLFVVTFNFFLYLRTFQIVILRQMYHVSFCELTCFFWLFVYLRLCQTLLIIFPECVIIDIFWHWSIYASALVIIEYSITLLNFLMCY